MYEYGIHITDDATSSLESFAESLNVASSAILEDAQWCEHDDCQDTISYIQSVTAESILGASLALSSLQSLEEERRVVSERAQRVIDQYEGLDGSSMRKLLNNKDHISHLLEVKLGLDRWAGARQASFEASKAASAHALLLLSTETRACEHLSDPDNVPTYSEDDVASYDFCSEVDAQFTEMLDELRRLAVVSQRGESRVATGVPCPPGRVVITGSV